MLKLRRSSLATLSKRNLKVGPTWSMVSPTIQTAIVRHRLLKQILYDGTISTPITKTRLFKYIENFTTKKGKFSDKKRSVIFHIPAQNIDCGYSLEPPHQGGSNEYPQSMFFRKKRKKNNVYPCKPQFYYTKVGFKGVKII